MLSRSDARGFRRLRPSHIHEPDAPATAVANREPAVRGHVRAIARRYRRRDGALQVGTVPRCLPAAAGRGSRRSNLKRDTRQRHDANHSEHRGDGFLIVPALICPP